MPQNQGRRLSPRERQSYQEDYLVKYRETMLNDQER